MVEEVTPEEVREKVEGDDEVQVVDIRHREAYEAGHIPGALSVPMPELPNRMDEIEWGDDVVVACPIGKSSVQAARLIGSFEGVDDPESVTSMAGGYDAWEYDLETGPDTDDGNE